MSTDKKPTKRKKNLLVDHPAWAERLSKEWNWEKNEELGIRPDEITAGSGKKVWWRCENGHEWEATIAGRVRGNGCPYCSGRFPIPGETDLPTIMPDLAREWHPTRNDDLTPQDVTKSSNKKVWWQCKCGHEWQATVNKRSQGRSCPYCSGRLPVAGETDLQTLMPDLAGEWHPARNGDLTPKDITRSSDKKVWWRCEHGHEWQAVVGSRASGCGCPYCAGTLPIVGETDLATTMPELAREWHPTRNGDLSPQDVTKGSNKKVWWRCDHGHEWQATIAHRVNGCGCPYCAGNLPIPGETDLATTMPELAKEWHPTKNCDLTPRDVMRGSHKKVWWRCEHGHEWQATVYSRADGVGCPYCAGNLPIPGETDLATTMPELAKEWHPTKNGTLTPRDVTRGSGKRVWWRCEHGHEWQARVADRANGNGCAVCAGKRILPGFNDLATTDPALAGEWHPTKNGDLAPHDVTRGSQKKVWWRCAHDHEWRATIASRASGCGCPYCSGRLPILGETDLATTMPDLAREWHPTRNGDLSPQDVTKGGSKKVWWRCDHGHEWQATVASRAIGGSGCPKCSSSRGEKDAAYWAESAGFVVQEQWRTQECCDKRPLPFDLMLYVPLGASLRTPLMSVALVEYDGIQHVDETTYFNMKNLISGYGFDYVQRHDAIKDAYCEATGRLLIRVPYTITGVDDIGAYIEAELRKHGFGWWFDRLDGSREDAA